jgi:hypothetical protein
MNPKSAFIVAHLRYKCHISWVHCLLSLRWGFHIFSIYRTLPFFPILILKQWPCCPFHSQKTEITRGDKTHSQNVLSSLHTPIFTYSTFLPVMNKLPLLLLHITTGLLYQISSSIITVRTGENMSFPLADMLP